MYKYVNVLRNRFFLIVLVAHFGLRHHQIMVQAFLVHQFVVRSGFENLTVLKTKQSRFETIFATIAGAL